MRNFIIIILCLAALTSSAQQVFVTETGKCFHKSAECSYLSKSTPTAIDSSTVANADYTACKKCYSIATTSTATDSGEKTITGKTIWIGPKGGKFYLDDKGVKHYLPKS